MNYIYCPSMLHKLINLYYWNISHQGLSMISLGTLSIVFQLALVRSNPVKMSLKHLTKIKLNISNISKHNETINFLWSIRRSKITI